jgi:hypothetical protein
MRTLMIVLLIALALAATESHACQFDTDCSVGSVCLKRGYNMYGVCAGGMQPGNSYDRIPTYNELQPQRNSGGTCQFDVQCGPGGSCVKSGFNMLGVCQ